ncbi:DNA polymerase-3 subunit epsilon [Fodinibius sediminis]|uniref:DNA polymerase-3 subunit epsilon n=2 Tax=Fodinibius sediminis TaxID=1214077 RepID=A0A521EEJ9_9BACT|nr:DNA polymerase-3 subunit epsilon [Fodinibius sediminis]
MHTPSFVDRYRQKFEGGPVYPPRIGDATFIILDTETTGLDVKKDYIISYGSIKVKNYAISISSARHYFLKQKKVGREAIKIHQIINVENALSLRDFVKLFLDDIENAIIVGHHIHFDIAMLEKAVRPLGLKKLLNARLDTRKLAIRLEMGKHAGHQFIPARDYGLDALCRRYHIPLDDRHTAAGDAFLTAQLFLKLLKKAKQKGITTMHDLMT